MLLLANVFCLFFLVLYSHFWAMRFSGPADSPSETTKSWSFTDGCDWGILNTWILPHKEVIALAYRTATSEQSLLWKVPLSLLSLPDTFLHWTLSSIPYFLLYASCPLPLSALLCLCSLACSCFAPTRAKRLILALRPSKLSQLSSFSLLSANISSNTLPGWWYGHQRAGWYVWPLWNYSAPCLLNLCLWSSWTCQHVRKWSFIHRKVQLNNFFCFSTVKVEHRTTVFLTTFVEVSSSQLCEVKTLLTAELKQTQLGDFISTYLPQHCSPAQTSTLLPSNDDTIS